MHELAKVRDFLSEITAYRLVTDMVAREQFILYFGYAFDFTPGCLGCPSELEAAINKINWLVKRHPEHETTLKRAMEINKYTMQAGKRVYSFKLGIMVTAINCTDAIAEALIEENPKHAEIFTIHTKANSAITAIPEAKQRAKKVTIGKKEAFDDIIEAPEPAQSAKKEPNQAKNKANGGRKPRKRPKK